MLLLIRHGRTKANAAGLLLGRSDLTLDDVGRTQAQAIAAHLRPQLADGARVVSSPLLRARETAGFLGLPVEVDDRWIELDYGDFEGRRADEVGVDVWDRWREDLSYVPAGGESLAGLAERVADACAELSAEARTADVVVVSHVSPIKAAMGWALGVGASTSWRSHLDPASITRVAITARGPVLHSFNDICHLTA